MAYMCVLNHLKECDGCEECEAPYEEDYGNEDFEHDYRRDEEYIERLEAEQ